MATRVKAPAWFWIAAVLIAAWDAWGLLACIAQFDLRAHPPAAPSYEQQLTLAAPGWVIWAFLVATLGGLLGALALLLRERRAVWLFRLSLAAVVVMFAYSFGATDVVARLGLVAAAGLPAVVFVEALLSLWLASVAAGRGWIGRA